ncbi:MAG: hypothetical protein ABEJ77_05945 [Halanaeroarchaeum sp.]
MDPDAPLPSLETTKNVLDGGHLWIQEWVTGPVLTVEMADSGMLSFDRVGDDTVDVPSLSEGKRHVRETVDREAYRRSVEDVDRLVLYGVGTRYEGVSYDWDALPPFLGVAVWDEGADRFAPPDVVDRFLETIGLASLPDVERERPADRFDRARFEPPSSAFRSGPVAGVVVRNKRGPMALLETDVPRASPAEDVDAALDAAIDRVVDRLVADGDQVPSSVAPETLTDRVFERVARVAHRDVADRLRRDPDGVRSRVARALREREDPSR